MLVQATPLSASFYLFEKEAKEIYEERYTENQVNDYLNTLMRINIAYLSRTENDGFPFIDPAAFNNQCHMYAYMAGKIKNGYKEKTIEEKLAYNEENRFLHLSFILSYTFLTDRRSLLGSIESSLLKGEVLIPEDNKPFYSFVKDHGGTLIRTARIALNSLFKKNIKELLGATRNQSSLHNELYQISLENLHLPSGRHQTALYTLPKFVGVAYLIEEKIAFVIKTKVISSRGSAQFPLYSTSSYPERDDAPVLVFEAISSQEYSIGEFRKIAEKCPSYFERKPSSTHRHKEEDRCQFCTQINDMETSHLNHFTKATEVIEESLSALGADFTKEMQPNLAALLKDDDKYPLLSQLFKRAIENIETLGVSMERPIALTIDHVYVDDAKHARSQEFRMNGSPKAYLQTRGFL